MAKVRIQAGTQSASSSSSTSSSLPTPASSKTPYTKPSSSDGAVALLTRVLREQGLSGWYKGMGAQIIKAVIAQALLFASKDQFELYTLAIMRFVYARAATGAVSV